MKELKRPWRLEIGRQVVLLVLFILLACYAAFNLASGLKSSHGHLTADLMTRGREYAVFRQGFYPMSRLQHPPVPAQFPNSVYPPYAQPMFGFFFV